MNFSSMKYLLKEGVKNVWNNRMMSFASIGVLVSCLLLTGAAVLFSANLSYAMKDIQDENVVTVYLKQEVGELEAVTLGSELKEIPNIKEIVFVSQQEALEQYTEILGPLFEGLEEDNFLPNAYRVTMEDLSLYDETVAKIKEIPQVDTLSDRSDAASKLTNRPLDFDYPQRGFPVYHQQYHPCDNVQPPSGNQHYEVGRRYQLVYPGALYCRGRGDRLDFSGYLYFSAEAGL